MRPLPVSCTRRHETSMALKVKVVVRDGSSLLFPVNFDNQIASSGFAWDGDGNPSPGAYSAGTTAGSATGRASSGTVSGSAAITVTGTAFTLTNLTITTNPVTAWGTVTGTVLPQRSNE